MVRPLCSRQETILSPLGGTMEKLGFLYVLNGVIAGMALAKLINGYAIVIQYYSQINIYWVHLIFSLIIFVLIVQYWFFLFDWDAPTRNFWVYLISLFYPMTLFFISSILFPNIEYIQEYTQEHIQKCANIKYIPEYIKECANKSFSFRNYYYDFRKWYYGIGVIGIVISYAHNALYNEKRFISKTQIIRLLSGVLVLCLAIFKEAWFHEPSILFAATILFLFLYSKYKI